MKCPKCSYENPPDTQFCSECGQAMPDPRAAAQARRSVPTWIWIVGAIILIAGILTICCGVAVGAVALWPTATPTPTPTATPTPTPTATPTATPTPTPTSTPTPTPVPITGRWLLEYDWGCEGDPRETLVTLFEDHTFSTGEDNHGTWSLSGSDITLTYPSGTEYTGEVSEGEMEGTMVSYDGREGCWSATRTGD
jgi:predicted nucleic acid-binding Zn ribbon protein